MTFDELHLILGVAFALGSTVALVVSLFRHRESVWTAVRRWLRRLADLLWSLG